MIKIILITLGILMLIEGLSLILFSKQIIKILKSLSRNQKNIIKIGFIEVIIAIFLILLANLM